MLFWNFNKKSTSVQGVAPRETAAQFRFVFDDKSDVSGWIPADSEAIVATWLD